MKNWLNNVRRWDWGREQARIFSAWAVGGVRFYATEEGSKTRRALAAVAAAMSLGSASSAFFFFSAADTATE
jgi:hypothetical protein